MNTKTLKQLDILNGGLRLTNSERKVNGVIIKFVIPDILSNFSAHIPAIKPKRARSIDPNPKKLKPKGINKLFFMFLNLLIDLIPRNNGINTAWKCAKNKIEKNLFIS